MLKKVALLFAVFILLVFCINATSFQSEEVKTPEMIWIFKTIKNVSEPCGTFTCYNSGICHTVSNGFVCLCRYPFFGERCEEDLCTRNPCHNNGTCHSDDQHGFTCLCKPNFFGKTCRLDICKINPCYNGGTCELHEDSYSCKCPFPYFGEYCENGPCSPNPCENGGECEIIDDSFSCTCKNPYFGETCELGPCASNPCKNGGECEEEGDSFKCTCESPFTGSTCEQKFCETDSECLHGGVCRQISRDKNVCVCALNYGGSRCEVKLLCVGLDQSCRMMNAVCVVVDNHAICACPNGTVYQRNSGLCEDICDHRQCLHGKCEIIGKTHKCNCDEGYTGSHCDEKERRFHENIIVWFTMTAFINLFMCLLLIGMFCAVCRIQRSFKGKVNI